MTTTTATDFYALLGVPPDATTAQIKSAYRKLAKQYHPDVNNSPDAAERFREITEAYDTLTDPDRRRRYDRLHGTRTDHQARAEHRPETPVPATGHAPTNGSANGNGSQVASRSSKSWKTSGWRSAAGTRKYPRPSSSSPAEPKANRPGWVTTPPAGGTSPASNTPRS